MKIHKLKKMIRLQHDETLTLGEYGPSIIYGHYSNFHGFSSTLNEILSPQNKHNIKS